MHKISLLERHVCVDVLKYEIRGSELACLTKGRECQKFEIVNELLMTSGIEKVGVLANHMQTWYPVSFKFKLKVLCSTGVFVTFEHLA